MIAVENLVKWYGPTLAVDNLSFKVEPGQIVGFLGPNGAGKSTTLRILIGYLPPTSGRATVDGLDTFEQSEQARTRIGYMPESNPLYPEMRVEEFLHYRGKLQSMDRASRRKRIDIVCARCGLSAVRRRLIGQLSRGNKQRVGLAQALLHDPPVLILDEPTAGLDPNQIGEFRKLIGELRGKHTVMISTHILPEVEKTADRVLIIARGRIVAEGSPQELRQKVSSGSRVLAEIKANPDTVAAAIRKLPGVASVETSTQDGWCRVVITPQPGRDIRGDLSQVIAANPWPVRELRHEMASLEQFFVEITASQDAAKVA